MIFPSAFAQGGKFFLSTYSKVPSKRDLNQKENQLTIVILVFIVLSNRRAALIALDPTA